ncbi:MAG: ATP synthase F1 subunit epsilon [Cyclobacteriaceae bacterium]|nr:ATP synthase F1 subunit epsilon [Cyclobacteriaceae bacterium]
MYLEIVTPDKKVFEGEVKVATFPGTDGSFQVLNNHSPLISSLTKGVLSYEDKDRLYELKIDGGVVEVLHNEIIVLAEGIIND